MASLKDYVTSDSIEDLFTDLSKETILLVSAEFDLFKAKMELDKLIAEEVSQPGFVAAKNMDMQEALRRAKWPSIFADIDAIKVAIEDHKGNLKTYEIEKKRIDTFISYFSVLSQG